MRIRMNMGGEVVDGRTYAFSSTTMIVLAYVSSSNTVSFLEDTDDNNKNKSNEDEDEGRYIDNEDRNYKDNWKDAILIRIADVRYYDEPHDDEHDLWLEQLVPGQVVVLLEVFVGALPQQHEFLQRYVFLCAP